MSCELLLDKCWSRQPAAVLEKLEKKFLLVEIKIPHCMRKVEVRAINHSICEVLDVSLCLKSLYRANGEGKERVQLNLCPSVCVQSRNPSYCWLNLRSSGRGGIQSIMVR